MCLIAARRVRITAIAVLLVYFRQIYTKYDESTTNLRQICGESAANLRQVYSKSTALQSRYD